MEADNGPHQKSRGLTTPVPSSRKQTTKPKLAGLTTGFPRKRMRYFDRRAKPAVAAKMYQPRVLHQSPCSVPLTRSTSATPLPVSSALAGHTISLRSWNSKDISITAQVTRQTRI